MQAIRRTTAAPTCAAGDAGSSRMVARTAVRSRKKALQGK